MKLKRNYIIAIISISIGIGILLYTIRKVSATECSPGDQKIMGYCVDRTPIYALCVDGKWEGTGLCQPSRQECTKTYCSECVCPACGSYNVQTAPKLSLSYNWMWHCLDCNNTWYDVSCGKIEDWEKCLDTIPLLGGV